MTTLVVPFVSSKSANAVWNVAGLLYVGFIFANAVFILFDDHIWTYFFVSLAYSLVYIVVAGIIVSLLIHALKVKGSGESAMIFVSILYHPVVLLLMILLKWIIDSV
jgi:cation transporter-like permease